MSDSALSVRYRKFRYQDQSGIADHGYRTKCPPMQIHCWYGIRIVLADTVHTNKTTLQFKPQIFKANCCFPRATISNKMHITNIKTDNYSMQKTNIIQLYLKVVQHCLKKALIHVSFSEISVNLKPNGNKFLVWLGGPDGVNNEKKNPDRKSATVLTDLLQWLKDKTSNWFEWKYIAETSDFREILSPGFPPAPSFSSSKAKT